ncbi:hypothetical protein BYT27DRAFT_7123766 [Phlegmacium glaucopus]|nr:hypothetical protein BYT27DRAFT_7123766 [Phlegmacium glaucopus]
MTRVFLKAFLHAAAAGVMGFGYYSLQRLPIDRWIREQYGGHFQYLTIQGLALAWITLATSFFSDVFPSFKGPRILKRYLVMISLPLSMVISLIYWTLLILSPQLILQVKETAAGAPEVPLSAHSEISPFTRIPLPVDLALHAMPAISILADFFLFESKYQWKDVQVGAPVTTAAFALWYGLWVEHCGKRNGVFPYPFLTENTFPIRIGIYLGATLLATASFTIINGLHR